MQVAYRRTDDTVMDVMANHLPAQKLLKMRKKLKMQKWGLARRGVMTDCEDHLVWRRTTGPSRADLVIKRARDCLIVELGNFMQCSRRMCNLIILKSKYLVFDLFYGLLSKYVTLVDDTE